MSIKPKRIIKPQETIEFHFKKQPTNIEVNKDKQMIDLQLQGFQGCQSSYDSEQQVLQTRKSKRLQQQTQLHKYFVTKEASLQSNDCQQKQQKRKSVKKIQCVPVIVVEDQQMAQVQRTLSGGQMLKILSSHKTTIMNELDVNKLCQRVVDYTIAQKKFIEDSTTVPYESLIRIVMAYFYKIILPHSYCNWDQLYHPESISEFLDDRNSSLIQYWLKLSYKQLKKRQPPKHTRDEFIDTEESAVYNNKKILIISQSENHMLYEMQSNPLTKNWKYQVLKVQGSSGDGKIALIQCLAKQQDIEVIITNEYTEKKVFEELFSSKTTSTVFLQQKDIEKKPKNQLDINENRSIKKLILHRQFLPTCFPKILENQRIPMIWIIDEQLETVQNQKTKWDIYNYQQNSNLETSLLIFLIMVIDENFYELFKPIRQQLMSSITRDGFTCTDIATQIETLIQGTKLNTTLTFQEIYDLSFAMQGNIRQILTWVNFNHYDPNLKQLQLLIYNNNNNLRYMMQNIPNPLKLPIFDKSDDDDQVDFKMTIENIFKNQEDDIMNINSQQTKVKYNNQYLNQMVKERCRIHKKYMQGFHLNTYNYNDLYSYNMLYELLAVDHFQNRNSIRTRRNNCEKINQIDIHVVLQELIGDENDYRLFIYYSKLRDMMQRQSRLRKNNQNN